MEYDELVDTFAQAVGVEKATAIVDEALATVGLADEETLSPDDVGDVCDVIQSQQSGYVSMVANELRVSIQAERRFETLLANVPEPAVVTTFEADGPVVESVNDAFVETFGYEADEATGRPLSSLIVPDEDALPAAALWARSHDEGTEVTRVTADGDLRTFLFRSAVVQRDSGETEGYGIYTDITERKRREQTLRHQNEQLEQFVDVISHDLRTPLEVSTGRIDLALEATDDETVRDHLLAARNATERMEALLEELLALARQGQTVGDRESVSLATTARDAWEHVPTGDATLAVADDTTIAADPNRLSQLFENLFRNSVTHNPSVPLTVTVGTTTTGFFVADDGVGIDEATQERVFEQGFSTDDDGTGFGLAIVETIAEAHGWSVTVTDSESGGARFEFSLP